MPEPGNLLAWDRYAYVRNNPINRVDPTGYVQVCAHGDLGGGCGSDDTGLYILSKYVDKNKEGWLSDGLAGLSQTEQNALSRDDWNPDVWEDAVGGPGV